MAGLLLLAACAEPEEPAGSAPDAPDAVSADSTGLAPDAVAADSAGVAADTAAGGPGDGADAGPPPLPTLPGEGAPRQYRLRLVNLLEREAFVFASAGAGRVAVDTVPGSDSTLVDIRLRADHVVLEARDPSGRLVKSEELDLDRSAINRWEIRRTDGSRIALRRPARPLVTAEHGDYPRSR